MQVYDVVIIGAGVQGLSAAYHLSAHSSLRVLVVESNTLPGRGASARSGSMLMKSRENKEKIELSIYSFDRYMAFREEFGVRFRYQPIGFLSVVPHSLASRYSIEHSIRLSLGVPSELVPIERINELSPTVSTDGIAFGVYCHEDGVIDPQLIMNTYFKFASENGVRFALSETATGIEIAKSCVTHVQTTVGRVACKWVVNAGGCNAAEISSWANEAIPLNNTTRHIFVGEISDPDFQRGPMVEDAELEWYYRGLGACRVMMGMGKQSIERNSPEADWSYLPRLRAAASLRAPKLSEAKFTSGSSGVRSITPDLLPIVGPVKNVEGWLNLCGWGGEGIMHAPAGGAMVCDLIAETGLYPHQKNCFRSSRFVLT